MSNLSDPVPSIVILILFVLSFFGVGICLITAGERHWRAALGGIGGRRRRSASKLEMLPQNPYQTIEIAVARPPQTADNGMQAAQTHNSIQMVQLEHSRQTYIEDSAAQS